MGNSNKSNLWDKYSDKRKIEELHRLLLMTREEIQSLKEDIYKKVDNAKNFAELKNIIKNICHPLWMSSQEFKESDLPFTKPEYTSRNYDEYVNL